jgi:hypothetical protein
MVQVLRPRPAALGPGARLELLRPKQGGDHVDRNPQTAGGVEQDHQHDQARLNSAA